MISVVFPAYNEEDNVTELHRRIKETLIQLGEPYEIIAVDNGSQDATLERLKHLSPARIVVLAKNLGQTAGLDAGIKAAKGDIIVTLDADLQNDPDDIPRLITKLNEGYDVVSGWRVDRADTLGRKVLSRLANWLTYKVTGLYLHDHACALKAYRAIFLKDVNLYGEMHVFLPAILFAQGAKIAEIPVKHHERKRGISKHNFIKAIKDLGDLATIKFISGYMLRPFIFFGGWGAASIFLGFLIVGTSIVLKIMHIRNFGQTPLPIIATLFITLGFLLFMLGFIAEMLIRIYYETKHERPYKIREVIEIR